MPGCTRAEVPYVFSWLITQSSAHAAASFWVNTQSIPSQKWTKLLERFNELAEKMCQPHLNL